MNTKIGYKFTNTYYKRLVEEVDSMNEDFKYEGSNDRAIVVKGEDGYAIVILRHISKGE